MSELLLEILSEEIPARMQARAADDLKALVLKGIEAQGLGHSSATAQVTPRRLTLIVEGLPAQSPDIEEEKKGPKLDAPEAALAGFLKANGLTSVEQAEVRELAKGKFYFAVRKVPGRPAPEVLKEVIEGALAAFPWPKSMRWAGDTTRWVRPIRSLLCLFAGQVVPVGFAGLVAGATTRGHRFLAPEPFTVHDAADYQGRLMEAWVMLDREDRKQAIREQAAKLARLEGLQVREDPGLLEEVAGLVEWPEVLLGRFDDAFMDLPPEVLITEMRSHQKYFALVDQEGRLAPRFLVVANLPDDDQGRAATIVAGNERVLKARLSDGRFFWDQDRTRRLEDLLPGLAERVFYQGLGTMADKAERLGNLAANLAPAVAAEADQARTAGRLAKADLASHMVGEFPELQGIMGGHYARHNGLPEAVAEAIRTHYSPAGPNDACPTQPVAVAVALADKIDTLVGFWAIGEKPTGSKDPFALRRAALGVIRLILENGLRLSLKEVFAAAAAQYGAAAENFDADDLLAFLAERLKVHLREDGVRHDLIDAVFALGEDDIAIAVKRISALTDFLNSDDGANLLAAHKRAANILRIEQKKDGTTYDGGVDPKALAEPAEQALHQALENARPAVDKLMERQDFAAVMSTLARLRAPLDAFFDTVTVNSDTPHLRINRLALLNVIVATTNRVADFARIDG
ncbi:glycine--tRNA ligase subunit beta [Roseospirillum parvum]|uniref:Glycine--tRNA ligase beta subunit n=1 Tax=Roseospirillum parvum TaxID=83401 RepID=A0A1G8AY76_9PROT|nr:glycine--tRNA ligase subunit beta [Roseospirillum parvum]SDH25888.1 glycyl-tRNA synthetase beta chain [Roseospirillum parvum]